MSNTTVPNIAEEVTPESSEALPVSSPQRLTMDQAMALGTLVRKFRPDWAWRPLMVRIQTVSLYGPLTAPEVVAFFVNAAASDAGLSVEEFECPAGYPWAPAREDD